MSRPTPATYKTTNWPAYNEAQKRRGSLTIWFDPEINWEATPNGKRGRQQTYSDAADTVSGWGGTTVVSTAVGEQLQRTWGQVPPVVLVSHHHVGGNFRLAWGRAPLVQTPKLTWPVPMPDEVNVVATAQDLQDPAFAAWVRQHTGRDVGEVTWQAIQSPILHRPQLPPYVLHWATLKRLPNEAGT